MKWIPKEYQRHALDFLLNNPRAQLWLEMGLGKTSVVLHAIDDLIDRAVLSRVLVVSTRRITKEVWPAEVAKWGLHIPVRDIEGSQKQRSALLDTPWFGIETITFEKLAWLFREHLQRRRGHPLPWDAIVFDESSKLKAVGTQRFRAIRRWVHAMPPRVWHLTGSPAPSGLLNVWAPTFLLDGGHRLGTTFTDFRERWFRPDYTGWKYVPREGADKHIHNKLQDVTLSMLAEDYLELPPLMVNDIKVELPAQVRETYHELEREMFIQLEAGTVEAANAGVLTGKCRQMANGALYLNGRNTEWSVLHDRKFEALDEVLEEAEGENIIVAYQFRSDLTRLKDSYRRAVSIDEPDAVKRWNAGEISMLLLHPASAGHGLNLQEGGRQMVMLGCPWSLDLYTQCADRIAGGLRRQRPTVIHRVLAARTVDEDVVTALEERTEVQEVLKRRMRRAAV